MVEEYSRSSIAGEDVKMTEEMRKAIDNCQEFLKKLSNGDFICICTRNGVFNAQSRQTQEHFILDVKSPLISHKIAVANEYWAKYFRPKLERDFVNKMVTEDTETNLLGLPSEMIVPESIQRKGTRKSFRREKTPEKELLKPETYLVTMEGVFMVIDRAAVSGYSKELKLDENRITDGILVPFMSDEFKSLPFFPKDNRHSNGQAAHPREESAELRPSHDDMVAVTRKFSGTEPVKEEEKADETFESAEEQGQDGGEAMDIVASVNVDPQVATPEKMPSLAREEKKGELKTKKEEKPQTLATIFQSLAPLKPSTSCSSGQPSLSSNKPSTSGSSSKSSHQPSTKPVSNGFGGSLHEKMETEESNEGTVASQKSRSGRSRSRWVDRVIPPLEEKRTPKSTSKKREADELFNGSAKKHKERSNSEVSNGSSVSPPPFLEPQAPMQEPVAEKLRKARIANLQSRLLPVNEDEPGPSNAPPPAPPALISVKLHHKSIFNPPFKKESLSVVESRDRVKRRTGKDRDSQSSSDSTASSSKSALFANGPVIGVKLPVLELFGGKTVKQEVLPEETKEETNKRTKRKKNGENEEPPQKTRQSYHRNASDKTRQAMKAALTGTGSGGSGDESYGKSKARGSDNSDGGDEYNTPPTTDDEEEIEMDPLIRLLTFHNYQPILDIKIPQEIAISLNRIKKRIDSGKIDPIRLSEIRAELEYPMDDDRIAQIRVELGSGSDEDEEEEEERMDESAPVEPKIEFDPESEVSFWVEGAQIPLGSVFHVTIDRNETDPELIRRNDDLMAQVKQSKIDNAAKEMKLRQKKTRERTMEQSVKSEAVVVKKEEKKEKKEKKSKKEKASREASEEKKEERSGQVYSDRDDYFAQVMKGDAHMSPGGFYSRSLAPLYKESNDFYKSLTKSEASLEWYRRPSVGPDANGLVYHVSGRTVRVGTKAADECTYQLEDLHNHREFRIGQIVWAKFQKEFWPGYIRSFIPAGKLEEYKGDVMMISWIGEAKPDVRGINRLQHNYICYADVFHFDLYFPAMYMPAKGDKLYPIAVGMAISYDGRPGYWEEHITKSVYDVMTSLTANTSSIPATQMARILSDAKPKNPTPSASDAAIKMISSKEKIHFECTYNGEYCGRNKNRFVPKLDSCEALGIDPQLVDDSVEDDFTLTPKMNYASSAKTSGLSFQPLVDIDYSYSMYSHTPAVADYTIWVQYLDETNVEQCVPIYKNPRGIPIDEEIKEKPKLPYDEMCKPMFFPDGSTAKNVLDVQWREIMREKCIDDGKPIPPEFLEPDNKRKSGPAAVPAKVPVSVKSEVTSHEVLHLMSIRQKAIDPESKFDDEEWQKNTAKCVEHRQLEFDAKEKRIGSAIEKQEQMKKQKLEMEAAAKREREEKALNRSMRNGPVIDPIPVWKVAKKGPRLSKDSEVPSPVPVTPKLIVKRGRPSKGSETKSVEPKIIEVKSIEPVPVEAVKPLEAATPRSRKKK